MRFSARLVRLRTALTFLLIFFFEIAMCADGADDFAAAPAVGAPTMAATRHVATSATVSLRAWDRIRALLLRKGRRKDGSRATLPGTGYPAPSPLLGI